MAGHAIAGAPLIFRNGVFYNVMQMNICRLQPVQLLYKRLYRLLLQEDVFQIRRCVLGYCIVLTQRNPIGCVMSCFFGILLCFHGMISHDTSPFFIMIFVS